MANNNTKKYPLPCDPNRRFSVILLYAFAYAVPNGDPNNNGAPRTLLDGNVYMTDTSQKSRMRRYIKTVDPSKYFYNERGPIPGRDEEAMVLEDKQRAVFEGLGYEVKKEGGSFKVYKDGEAVPSQEATAAAGKTIRALYYDAKVFGVTGASKQFNFDNTRGCLIVHPAISVDPPEMIEETITRSVHSKDDKQGQMGSRERIRFAVLRSHVEYIPVQGLANGVEADDLFLVKSALVNWPLIHRSTMSGHITLLKAVFFEHPNQLGAAPDHELWQRVQVEFTGRAEGKQYPTGPEDYTITCHGLDDLPGGVKAYEFDAQRALEVLTGIL